MKIGEVYEVIPTLQMIVNGVNVSAFYGEFIGYDSREKCVFKNNYGAYVGYWDAASSRAILDTATFVSLKDANEYGGKVTFVREWP